MSPFASIIIPNWNGREFLVRCIGATLQSAAESGFDCEVMVVDDASTDGSEAVIERQFASVRLLRNPVNVGFGETCNRGAAECSGEIVLFLNNDLVPRPNLIRELVSPMKADSLVFGVSGKTIDWRTGTPNHLNMRASFSRGKLALHYDDPRELSSTMFLQGGSCAVRRQEFLRLGGFCRLYSPGYWEDYDLSYLALKAGWKNLYNPEAVGHHFGQGSMTRAFGEAGVQLLKERNRLLFALLNFTDEQMLKEWISGIPRHAAWCREPRLKIRLHALLATMRKGVEVLAEKERRAPLLRRSDLTVFREFGKVA